MDHNEHDNDPLAPPPSHTHHHSGDDETQGYSHDQTVPNLESGAGGGDRYDHDDFDQSGDPKNFHVGENDDLDLPANFAKEAVAAAAKHRDDDGEDFYGQDEGDDEDYYNQQHGQFQQENPYSDDSEEAMYYRQQQQQQHQQQHMQYMESEGEGGSSLDNSANSSNPFAQSDSSYLASSVGSAANAQRSYDHEFATGGAEDDRPIMGGGYPQGYGVEGERSPMSDDSQQHQQLQHQQDDTRHRGDEVYDDEEDEEDEEEGLARDDIEERRLCESGGSYPEQEASYGASPPEAERYGEQRSNADDDLAEGQRLESHPDDEYRGRGQVGYGDEADGALKMAGMGIPAGRLEDEDEGDSDSERQAGTFEYNKMEEEETTEDVSGDEEVGVDQRQDLQPAAGFDNHAFDDNDDEEAEVVQRRVVDDDVIVEDTHDDGFDDVRREEEPADEMDSRTHQQFEENQQQFEEPHQGQEVAAVPEQADQFVSQENERVKPEDDSFGMVSSNTEDQQQELEVAEDRGYGLNPEDEEDEDEMKTNLPIRSDNYMNIDCTGHNFGKGYGGDECEDEGDEFDHSGGSDVLRGDGNEEDGRMEYTEERVEEGDGYKMKVEEEFEKEKTTAVESESKADHEFDSNIDIKDEEEIDIVAGSSGMAVDDGFAGEQKPAQSEEEEDYSDYRREKEEGLEEDKENYTPQQTHYDDLREPYNEQHESDESELKQEVASNLLSGGVSSVAGYEFAISETEKQQQQVADVDMYGGVGEEEEGIQRQEEQLLESTNQSAVESSNTPSSLGGDFQAMTSLKGGEEGGETGKPPRSFVDMIEDMASPEMIPQPLPSPPKPESMSHEFDPLAPADNSDDEKDDSDFIMEKQQLQQQQMDSQQPLYQQHEDQINSQLHDGGGLYDTNHLNNGDARDESSDELCLRAGEVEGETKFGVDGSAITTSADQNLMGASDEDDVSPQSGGYQEEQQQLQQQEYDEEDDEEDDVVNAGLATDYTTTTTTETTETEERSGADIDSTSLGQAGFEQGFETGGGVDTDNALMSMSMEGSFYDDGGDLMGGADGMNGPNEGSNLLIQSAITEVSEPTSSFSPHMDSVLRSEQQAFEEKLSEQNNADGEDSSMYSQEESAPLEERQVTPEQSTATEAAIPSGFEDRPVEPVVSSTVNDLDFGQQNEVMGQGQQFDDDPHQKQNAFFEDGEEDVDVSSQPVTQNGGAACEMGVAAPGNENVSSSVDDPFGLQRNDLEVGVGGSVCEVGGEFDSSSVDTNAALIGGGGFVDTPANSSAVNGYHHEEESASVVSNEISDNFMRDDANEVTNSSAAFEAQELDQGTITVTDEGVDKTGAAATDDISISSAAEVSEISSSQPAVSSSVDAVVAPAAGAAVTEKEEKKKPADEKEKKKTGVTKEKKESTTKTSTAKKSTSATTKTSTTSAKKTTTTTTTATAKKTTTTATATKSTTATKTSSRPTSARPTSASSTAAKKPETPKSTTAPTRKPASASAADKKATSPTKPASTTPGSAKPLPRYAQPVTPRKPRDASTSAPGSADTAKKTPTTRPSTAPTTPRTRPTSATAKSTTSTTSRLTSTTASTTSSPRPKTSPTKLSNGSTPTSEKRSTSPTKRYTPRTTASSAAKATTEKKEVKSSPRTPLAARSPTKLASPRTPSNSATPRSGAAATNGKSATPKKPDYSNVTSRIGSKDKMTHKPGGGNVKIENRKVKVEAKSKIGSLDNASHKPQGGDKKVENGADGGSPV